MSTTNTSAMTSTLTTTATSTTSTTGISGTDNSLLQSFKKLNVSSEPTSKALEYIDKKPIAPENLNIKDLAELGGYSRINELKKEYKTIFQARSNMLQMLYWISSKDMSKDNDAIEQVKKLIVDLRDFDHQLSDIYKEMKKIQERQLLLDVKIKLPKFGKVKAVPWDAISCLPFFDPQQEKPKLYCVWQILTNFAESQELSENAFKQILRSCMRGEALEIYIDFRDEPVSKIIRVLKERFGSFPSRSDFEMQKENFKRMPNEPLACAMSRYENILTELYGHLPPEELNTLKETNCQSMVKQIATANARKELHRSETMAQLDGIYEYSYKERLNKLSFEEKLIDQLEKESNSQRPGFVNTLSIGHQPTNIDKQTSKKTNLKQTPTKTGAKQEPQHNKYQNDSYEDNDDRYYGAGFYEDNDIPRPPIITTTFRIESDNEDY